MKRLAIALMLPGLIILGFLVWQNVGTNIAASDSQNEARAVITKSLADHAKSAPAYPWTTKSEPIKPKKVKVGSKYVEAVGVLSIPSISVMDAAVVDDFTQAALDEGLVGSMGVKPGEIGNFVVIGHVVTHGEIFKDLKELRKDDLVTVKTTTGTFTYKIRGGPVTIVDTDNWVLRDNPNKQKNAVATKPVITLITCAAALFHSNKRVAIFGDLVKGTP